MKLKAVNILILFSGAFILSCKKETAEPADLGLNYVPQETGLYVIYDVTEIFIDSAVNKYDTSHYLLKEKIHSQFIDNSGRPSLRIERYWRTADSLSWDIKDVWYSTRTNYGYEKIEENERFIKMEFPLKEGNEWNGNSLNNLPEWNYTPEWVGSAYSHTGYSFDKTAKILQRDNFNYVEYEYAWEIYAENVGLIRRELYDLDINNGNVNNVRKGYVLLQNMISYGYE